MKDMTAKVSCFARAYHYRMNEVRIFADEAAYQLLGDDYEKIAESMKQGASYFLPGFRGDPEEALRLIVDRQLSPPVLARSAFCENALREAQEAGCGQYVILAAGYDTFGIRNRDGGLRVFEADVPEMVRDKQERIGKAGLSSSSVCVPCDLADPSWAKKLAGSGFEREKKAFFSLLGISYYLAEEDLRSLLDTLAGLLAEGSWICLDYPSDEEGIHGRITRELAAGAGEAMQAQYTAAGMEKLLEEYGFMIIEHDGPSEVTGKLFSGYNNNVIHSRIEAPEGVRYILAARKG